ncbi:MAG: ATP-binding protein [Marivibrio sp.]|uniref:sensor histidine kinase n=1 Tax=Marivibrio sp. TaxID=2039719 RepID=UPI0032EFE385
MSATSEPMARMRRAAPTRPAGRRGYAARRTLGRLVVSRATLAAVAAAALGVAVFSALAYETYSRLSAQTVEYRENLQWGLYQLQKELLSALLDAERAAAGEPIAAADLLLAYDIFVSRLTLLQQADVFAAVVKDPLIAPAVAQTAETVSALDAALGRRGGAAVEGDPRVIARLLIAHLGPLRDPLQDMTVAAASRTMQLNTAQNAELQHLLLVMEAVFLLVVILIAATGFAAVAAFRRIEAKQLAMRLHEEGLRAAKLQALGALAGGVAHEINTPAQFVSDNLTFVQEGIDDLLASEAPKDADAQARRDYLRAELPQALAEMRSGLTRIGDITRAVRRFTYADDGDKAEVDLNAVARTTLTLAKNEIGGAIRVDLDLPHAPVLVRGRAGELSQVVLNLLTNAADAVRERVMQEDAPLRPGLIRLSLSTAARGAGGGPCVRLVVADNGAGLDQATLARVFDPFFSTKPPGRGAGQGLSICRNIVEGRHGGRLTLDGAPGAGARATVELPAA